MSSRISISSPRLQSRSIRPSTMPTWPPPELSRTIRSGQAPAMVPPLNQAVLALLPNPVALKEEVQDPVARLAPLRSSASCCRCRTRVRSTPRCGSAREAISLRPCAGTASRVRTRRWRWRGDGDEDDDGDDDEDDDENEIARLIVLLSVGTKLLRMSRVFALLPSFLYVS